MNRLRYIMVVVLTTAVLVFAVQNLHTVAEPGGDIAGTPVGRGD
jgi:hypothetical protein